MFGPIRGFGPPKRATARLLIAWVGHAPGLWLIYREKLPRSLIAANAVAVFLTAIAIACVLVSGRFVHRIATAIVVWIFCHVLWGSYLVWHLRSR
jgi:intracellular septation protein A